MLHLPGIEIRKKKSLFELRRWAVTKDVDLLDVGEGGFQVAKNVLHKHIYAVLCVIQFVRHNDHALTFCRLCVSASSLDPRMSSEECSLAMIPMSGLNFPLASYGSIFREIYLQNHTLAITTLYQ